MRGGPRGLSAPTCSPTRRQRRRAVDWVRKNGKPYTDDLRGSACRRLSFEFYGTQVHTSRADARLGLRLAQPRACSPTAARATASSLSYTHAGQRRRVLHGSTTITCSSCRSRSGSRCCSAADVGYGLDIGDTTSLPPYRQFFARRPGHRPRLPGEPAGPEGQLRQPLRRQPAVVAQTELILPMPEKLHTSARVSLFFDIGNVFSTDNVDLRRPRRRDARQLQVQV